MLTVQTFLERSGVHGIGLFATNAIAAGAIVWEFNPLIDLRYSPREWQRLKTALAPQSFANLRRYSYKEKDFIYLCLDNAQFMNHSDTAANIGQMKDADRMLARRLILAGEELLCNYEEYSDEDDYHLAAIRKLKSGARIP